MPEGSRTYDPKKVNVSVTRLSTGESRILTGYADGTFINCVKNADLFDRVTGAHGDVTRVENNDKSGNVTVTLKNTSPSNSWLRAIANIGERVSIHVKDSNPDSKLLAGGDDAWMLRPADESRATSVESTVWNFTVSNYFSKNE